MPIDMRDFENIKQADRFYPESVPCFDYEPLQSNFIIVSSPEPIKRGVISRISFKEGDLLCRWTGFHLKDQTLHSLQHTEDSIFIHDPYFVGIFLHSCSPNCVLNMETMEVFACKDIGVFDRLTLNYNKTEKKLYQGFHCQCGNDGCIEWVNGYGTKHAKV